MRLIRALLLALVSAFVASGVVYFAFVRPKVRGWGLDPHEAELPLPGDDLVADPSHVETRGITVHAPVSKVWPWLVQMGFGRAGWYSYDMLDNKAAVEEIKPEFQTLSVGDVMPTHPGGGFSVRVVDRERALVLYTDSDLLRSQAERTENESYPEIKASWAFYLQPEDGGTRLIERFRAKTPGSGPATAVLGEIMGTGIVLMTRKQMLSIKERVERLELAETEPTDTEPVWPAHDLAPAATTESAD
ncbi:MAG: SRPBCC family protein [Chloroflexota bacterium]